MPTYEYRCEKCGNEFEAIQKITDDPLKSCSKCEGQVHRLIAATAGCSAEKAGPQCGTCPANTD
jgi:putative FmdB family regulatory protein